MRAISATFWVPQPPGPGGNAGGIDGPGPGHAIAAESHCMRSGFEALPTFHRGVPPFPCLREVRVVVLSALALPHRVRLHSHRLVSLTDVSFPVPCPRSPSQNALEVALEEGHSTVTVLRTTVSSPLDSRHPIRTQRHTRRTGDRDAYPFHSQQHHVRSCL